MICIHNTSTNPYFNLAAEEYFLKEFTEDFFMLWRNAPAIIIGKNQNAMSEINVDYVTENNIPVVRRLSGGGAVFHDLGNINFTFISNNGNKEFNNFKKFTQPIIEVLQSLSVNAEFSGRNDLTIDGRKFSGNAQYGYKNRMLHHGTLLFSSNMTDLSKALKVKPIKFEGKGVKSVASRVTNIREHLKNPLTTEEFLDLIMKFILENHREHRVYELSDEDKVKITRLSEEKYSTWDWNFGHSPKYTFDNTKKFDGGTIEIYLNVTNGIIENAKIYGDFFGLKDVSELEKLLIGKRHSREDIEAVISSINMEDYFLNVKASEFMDMFF